MNLYTRILFAALAPLVLAFGYSVFSLSTIVDNDAVAAARSYELEGRLVSLKLQNLTAQLSMTADILSRSREVAQRMKGGDVDALYAWGSNFIRPGLTRIIFTDMRGLVLARAHQEFMFGDDLGTSPAVVHALEAGKHMGATVLSGHECLYFAQVVRLYDEIPVGVIIVAVDIDEPLLRSIAEGTRALISYHSATQAEISSAAVEAPVYTSTFEFQSSSDAGSGGTFSIYFQTDENLQQLANYRTTLYVVMALVFLLLPLPVYWVVRYHLAPFSSMTKSLDRLNAGIVSSESLRAELCTLCEKGRGEVSKVARAVISFSSSMDESLRELLEKNNQLDAMAKTDVLTGLSNRAHLYAMLQYELTRAERYEVPLAVAMIDIDQFKSVNDTYGHAVGDAVLIQFAALLKQHSREIDVVGRWGGEEFLVILSGVPGQGAMVWAERVRAACEEADFSGGKGVTCSIGVASNVSGMGMEALLNRADDALYSAKRSGRNRVVGSMGAEHEGPLA